jgi:hypothetical protein
MRSHWERINSPWPWPWPRKINTPWPWPWPWQWRIFKGLFARRWLSIALAESLSHRHGVASLFKCTGRIELLASHSALVPLWPRYYWMWQTFIADDPETFSCGIRWSFLQGLFASVLIFKEQKIRNNKTSNQSFLNRWPGCLQENRLSDHNLFLIQWAKRS